MFTAEAEARIRNVVAIECDRQHVGEDRRRFLFSAYSRAYEAFQAGLLLDADLILSLAGELEPDNGGRLRGTPVTFADGGFAVAPASVPAAFGQLVTVVDSFMGADEAEVRYWIREFLVVHPFADGNGRTAWLLYNWLRGSWADPAELPYFNF